MDQRIDMLERDVCAIKADIAVIKSTYWTREDARLLDTRLSHIEVAVATLKTDVAELKKEVARLNAEIVKIRAEMQNFSTKADLLDLEARLKTWMVGIMFSTLTITAAIQIGLYTAFTR